jgi:hypothetical protein
VIAKQSREGGFQSRILAELLLGTTPALRATPPDSGGEPRDSNFRSADSSPLLRRGNPAARQVVHSFIDRAYI